MNTLTVKKAPEKIDKNVTNINIFLAGSIDMGLAEHWQEDVTNQLLSSEKLKGRKLQILNPRRDDWDSSWLQTKSNPQFREQVEWELNGLTGSSYIFFYFGKDSKSPITLAEFGLIKGLTTGLRWINCIVYCPDEFYRKGNVDIMNDTIGIKFPLYNNYQEAVNNLIELLAQ